ncbi:MAG: hypothetical protein ACE5KI_02415, partial [Dehalococcoidia bacterium]
MIRTGHAHLVSDAADLKEVGQAFEDPRDRPRLWYVPREGWVTFAIVLLLLFCVVWSVESADWVDDLPSVVLIAFLGATAGLGLAKIRYTGLALILIGLVLGYLVVIWQTWGLTADEGIFGKTDDLIDRFRIWISAAQEGGISADPLPFVTIIVTLAWLLSFFTAWVVFRYLRFWPVIVPTAIALSLNLLYLPDNFWLYFYLYILAALLLAMRLYLVKKQREWR